MRLLSKNELNIPSGGLTNMQSSTLIGMAAQALLKLGLNYCLSEYTRKSEVYTYIVFPVVELATKYMSYRVSDYYLDDSAT